MTGTLYDLVLRGGRVIDPSQGLDGALDVGVRAGRVEAVAPALPLERAREVIDARGRIVLPGLIDTHAHVYQFVTGRFGLEADMVGVHSGTTTVVDQGGPSCMTLPGFRKFVAEPAATRVYAFLSAYLVGWSRGPLLPGPLRARRRRRSGHDPRGAGEPRPDPRHQGARRDRRGRALGARGPPPRGGDRPRGRSPALRPLRPALAPPQVRRRRRGSGHDPRPRRRDPPARATSWRTRSPAIRAASSTVAVGSTPSSGRRWRAASASTSATAPTSASTWRAACWTRGSSPTRSAPTSTATTRRCRGRPGRRPARIPIPSSIPSPGARASASRAR